MFYFTCDHSLTVSMADVKSRRTPLFHHVIALATRVASSMHQCFM